MAKEPFPVDRGWAWVIVLAAFMSAFLLLGVMKSFGLLMIELQDYFHVSTSLAALVIGVTSIVFALLSPVCIMLGQTLGVRVVALTGAVIGSVGIILSSQLVSIEYVIVTFGVCLGVSFASLYGNSLVSLGTYFQKKRALANGVALAGASVGQFVMPPVIEFLLDTHHLSGCLLLMGGIFIHSVVAACLLRSVSSWAPRKSATSVSTEQDKTGSQENTRLTMDDECADVGTPSDPGIEDKRMTSANSDEEITCSETMISHTDNHNNTTNDHGNDDGVISDDDLCQADENKSASYSSKTFKTSGSDQAVPGGIKHVTDTKTSLQEVEQKEYGDSSCDPLSHTPLLSQIEAKESRLDPEDTIQTSQSRTNNKTCHADRTLSIKSDSQKPGPANNENTAKDPGFCAKLKASFDFSFLKSYLAILIMCVNFLGSFGFFNVVVFLPATVQSRGMDAYDKAMVVSASGVGDLVGRLLTAAIGDRNFIPRYRLQALSIILTGVSIGVLMWADTLAWMVVLCALYGVFSGLNVSVSAVVVIDFVGMANMPRILGLMVLVNGIGFFAGQPLMGALADASGSFLPVLGLSAVSCLMSGVLLLCYPAVLAWERKLPPHRSLLPPQDQQNN